MFCIQIAYNYFQASWLLLRATTSFFPGAFVAGTRGCTWFVRAPSNNCTISPTDKWISRGEAHTVGACTEGAGAVPLRPALIPGGRPPPRLIHYLSTKLFRPPVAHNINHLLNLSLYYFKPQCIFRALRQEAVDKLR